MQDWASFKGLQLLPGAPQSILQLQMATLLLGAILFRLLSITVARGISRIGARRVER